jgi:hypothetical protein
MRELKITQGNEVYEVAHMEGHTRLFSRRLCVPESELTQTKR